MTRRKSSGSASFDEQRMVECMSAWPILARTRMVIPQAIPESLDHSRLDRRFRSLFLICNPRSSYGYKGLVEIEYPSQLATAKRWFLLASRLPVQMMNERVSCENHETVSSNISISSNVFARLYLCEKYSSLSDARLSACLRRRPFLIRPTQQNLSIEVHFAQIIKTFRSAYLWAVSITKACELGNSEVSDIGKTNRSSLIS
jgi:hypothetical protein